MEKENCIESFLISFFLRNIKISPKCEQELRTSFLYSPDLNRVLLKTATLKWQFVGYPSKPI